MPYYQIAMCDIPSLSIREVIVPIKGDTVIVNFRHQRFKNQLVFAAFLKLHFTDGSEIYTDLRIKESGDIVVSNAVRSRLQEQLDIIFTSYFIRLTGGSYDDV